MEKIIWLNKEYRFPSKINVHFFIAEEKTLHVEVVNWQWFVNGRDFKFILSTSLTVLKIEQWMFQYFAQKCSALS